MYLSNEMLDEQAYISMLYDRLDALRKQVSDRLEQVLRDAGGSQAQARTERESTAAMYIERLTQLGAAENGLCFARLDFRDGGCRYIGRLGILDDHGDYEPLLLDWRAPAARPFYVATPLSPEGVVRRRHIKMAGRTVVGIDDEVLDLTETSVERGELAGEAALLAALNTSRTGHMGDIVETIQAEQDQVIRSEHRGVLVVQGGPGTGKTVVALHRAAYLLYTYRDLLARRGVLIVGPNATFLRYIEEVLPALGETGALLTTIGELYPGISARRDESPEAAEVKGRLAMADEVIPAAVRDRQRVPEGVLEIVTEHGVLRLDRRTCLAARAHARATEQPHNQARAIFAREVIGALARQVADRLGADPYACDPLGGGDAPGEGSNLLDDDSVDDIRADLRADVGVHDALDGLWPELTPQRLLTDLFSSPERLAVAAAGFTEAERRLLARDPARGWTSADVSLLDEAAELLGEDNRGAEALAEQQRQKHVAYAQGVLDGSRPVDLDDGDEPETLLASDLLDADQLAERHEAPDTRTTAQRAASDRTWAFGHVIVDEAQELSPMAWRMLMRRCPTRSMTIVGDIDQTSDLAGASSWHEALEPHVGERWRLQQLTLNYRTPAEIMAVATGLLSRFGRAPNPPESVRQTGHAPWQLTVAAAELVHRLAAIAVREVTETGAGRLAVIVPATRCEELGDAVATAVPGTAYGADPELETPTVVLSAKQAKGLEFDTVLVVDPERILAESRRGFGDLYVALTRATQWLGIVHTE